VQSAEPMDATCPHTGDRYHLVARHLTLI
jgi:hypothetical protein